MPPQRIRNANLNALVSNYTVSASRQRITALGAQIYTTVERSKIELIERNTLENKYQAMESTTTDTNLQNCSRTAKSMACVIKDVQVSFTGFAMYILRS